MKKIFICCIFAGFMSVVTMPFAHAVATAGEKCDFNGSELVDGARELVKCATYNLSNASECYVYCKNGNLIYGIRTCRDGFYRLEPYSVPSDLYQQCASKKAACESSGADAHWNDTYCD